MAAKHNIARNRGVVSSLQRERMGREKTQRWMAELAGITRQSYAAIESGRAVPSTEVALRLAKGLGLRVEDLFSLSGDPPVSVEAERVGRGPVSGSPTRLYSIGGKALGLPLRGTGALVPSLADGIGEGFGDRLRVELFEERPDPCDLVVAGCDPSFRLIAQGLRVQSGTEALWIPRSSRAALEALARGHAHVAGVHLLDPETATYNAPWIQRLVPFPCTQIRYARWEQCLIVGAGNPLGVERVDDLASGHIRFVNREVGSGSRAMMDRCLAEAGVPEHAVSGYEETNALSHLGVAEAVLGGLADAGVAIRLSALTYGLSAIPLAEERFDLVVPDHFLEHRPVQELLEILRTPGIQRQVEALGGYDAEGMGLPC
jgi:putative molybdopterin biosynthesis protein